MPLLSLVFALPDDSGSITGVHRIGEATFDRPLQLGDAVQMELVLDGGGSLDVDATVVCPGRMRQRLTSAAPLLAGLDESAADLDCVLNIPV